MKNEIDTFEAASSDAPNEETTRRRFLKGVGVAGLCAAGARGMTGRASAEWSPPVLDNYGTIIDMVEDAGADPDGNEPIGPQLREYADDDTLLVFPPGRYRMNRQFRFSGFENFGIYGMWNVTIVPDNYYDFDDGGDWNYRLFRLGVSYAPGKDLLFKNIFVDQTASDTGIRVLDAAVSDGLHVQNVNVQGRHDSGTWGPLRTVITDPDGSGVVRGFRAPDGGDWTEDTPGDRLWRGPTGIICNSYNKGTITFKDCELGGFPDNGLYAANGSGKIIVDGGFYKNSQTASVRVGGRNSIVKNAKIVVDESSGRGNQHAIRVENSNYVRVVNCDVEVSDPNGDAIKTMNVGLFRLEDSTVRTAGDEVVHGLRIQDKTEMARIKRSTFVHETPGGFSVFIEDGPNPVYVEDTAFTGAGGHESARAAIRCDRDDCQFRNLDVEQTGSWRRRAIEIHGNECLLYEGRYVGRMTPLLNYGDDTWVESVYAESVDDDEAVRLYENGSGVYLKKNTLVNGIDDRGCDGLRLYDNSY
ncbi:twin-arginine translocation signal domain-containing protein [Haladaptatus salinisoli]|uniref:twin-arginine translocation signal domain-containing protein n=1 Tax=Haladaptatus salinisoli TaxID=2884876 RepID=UPI001D0A0017|nr:twin-arginine translocation signal domain-containing protein [Haladaptatus salinisoli]